MMAYYKKPTYGAVKVRRDRKPMATYGPTKNTPLPPSMRDAQKMGLDLAKGRRVSKKWRRAV
jgi:hypothetical protein